MRVGRGTALVVVATVACLVTPMAGSAAAGEFVAIPVSTALEAQEFPAAVLKADGTLYVVWHDTRLGDRDIYAQRYNPDGSAAWDPDGRPLVVGEREQGWVYAADDGLDGLVVLWSDSASSGRELYAQRFDAQAMPQWHPGGAPVCVVSSGKDDHKMVSDGHGGYHVVWEDWRRDSLDIYGQWIDADGNALWHDEGLAIADAAGHQYDPSVAAFEDGAVVAWWSVEGAKWRVYAQRIGKDGRRLWGTEGVLATVTEANQSAPVVVSDGQGGAFVAWVDSTSDDGTFSNLDIFAQHIGPDGRREWGDVGRPICDAPGTQHQVAAIADGRGGLNMAWTDARDVFDDIYMQHVQADGSFGWPANGLAVCLEDGRQRDPHLALAGSDVWVTWFDYRRETPDETPEDIYVQRIDDAGAFLYSRGGLAVGTRPGARGYLALTVNGPHVAVTWMDLLNEGADVYAAVRQVPSNH